MSVWMELGDLRVCGSTPSVGQDESSWRRPVIWGLPDWVHLTDAEGGLVLSWRIALKQEAVVAHVAVPLLGVSTGLRSFTPLAVAAWFARCGELPVTGTWAAWVRHPAAVGVFTAAAVGEYVADKLPGTPNRTAPVPLVGRLVLGGFVGAVVAAAFRRPVAGGVAMGAVGAAVGAYGGFSLRRGLTKVAGLPDLPVALAGDVAAVAMAACSLRQLAD